MSIAQNLEKILNKLLNTSCKLVAVTKTHPVEVLMQAYSAGYKIYGENKVQELVDKYEQMPKDIEWHMIGHLQSNKVKYIVPFVSLIHSIDSVSLLKEVNKQAAKVDKVVNCLLQVYIATEETKFGLAEDELLAFLASDELKSFKNVKIVGLMGMASNTDSKDQVRKEFKSLKATFEKVKNNFESENVVMKELSMGMSGDYAIAIEEGSTLIRVGSAIFGNR